MGLGRLSLPLLIVGCASGVLAKTGPLPRAQSQVLFNNSKQGSFTESYRGISRSGADFEAAVLSEISRAKSSVRVAVQELSLPRVARALAAKKRQGVDVRVVLENNYDVAYSRLSADELAALPAYSLGKYSEFLLLADAMGDKNGTASPREQLAVDAIEILRTAGVPTINDTADGSKGSGLMHHKFIVIDGATTVVTSANFSTSDFFGDFGNRASRGNSNAYLSFESEELARLFVEEFEIMWGNGSPGSSRFGINKPYRTARRIALKDSSVVSVQFSPQSKRLRWNDSPNGLIARTLSTARHSIDFALFAFSEQRLADVMDRPGVRVRGLVEPTFAYRDYSELLDLMGVEMLNDKCVFERGNRPWRTPAAEVGSPRLADGDKLHHKYAVIDGKTTVFGSHNWSEAANSINDETLLIIESASIGSKFSEELDRLMERSVLGVQPWLLKQIRSLENACR